MERQLEQGRWPTNTDVGQRAETACDVDMRLPLFSGSGCMDVPCNPNSCSPRPQPRGPLSDSVIGVRRTLHDLILCITVSSGVTVRAPGESQFAGPPRRPRRPRAFESPSYSINSTTVPPAYWHDFQWYKRWREYFTRLGNLALYGDVRGYHTLRLWTALPLFHTFWSPPPSVRVRQFLATLIFLPIRPPRSSFGGPCPAIYLMVEIWMINSVSLGSNHYDSSISGSPLVTSCLINFPSVIGRLHHLDDCISYLQNAAFLSTISDPRRPLSVQSLARARFERYRLSGQLDELELSILHFTEALYLPLPWDIRPPFLNIVQILCLLTIAIVLRAEESEQPRAEDVKFCIVCLRYLRGQWHDVPDLSIDIPRPVTVFLLGALALQVQLEARDVGRDHIEEMAELCDELLNSNIPIESLTSPIMAFARTVPAYLRTSNRWQIPSELVIDCLRKVTMRRPDLQIVSLMLAASLANRFFVTPSDADYREGMAHFDKIINSYAPDDESRHYKEAALQMAASLALSQSGAYGMPEHLEEAIYRFRTLLDATSLDDARRAAIIRELSDLHESRQRYFSVPPTSENAPSRTSGSDKLPSFRDLTTSLPELNTTRPNSPLKFAQHLNALLLVPYKHLTDIADIESGIKYCRQLLTSFPRSTPAPYARIALTLLLYRAFECTNQMEYLHEAIETARHHINTADPQTFVSASLLMLVRLLHERLYKLCNIEDLDELLRLYPIAAKHENIVSADQFATSCQWASIAHRFGHHSTSAAYDHAMSSMQAFLTFGPTLDIQHSHLRSLSNILKTMPLDYASYQIQRNQLKQAIEILERGRVLLWSQMRGLRTSVDEIRLADPHLADKFASVNRDLEMLTFSFSPQSGFDGGNSDLKGVDPFGHLVVRQRTLLHEREKLISQIQALPGFNTFLKPPSFDTLDSVASHGPVIIINHSSWRCDIVILLHDTPPSVIPTSHDFYARTIKLQDRLLGERKKSLDSDMYEDALRFVLKELYELVGRPVIKRLNELNIPEQSRVWWCPTSVFCSLPLHAMGPIPSKRGRNQYFLDLYIPSYIPSLSALIKSRIRGPRVIHKPSILLIAQPNKTMPQALKEIKAVKEVNTQVTTLISEEATPAAVLAGFRDHPFVHIVSHGTLEPGKPFEASFKLHRGKRLLLLDIARSRLPHAEFAFLSACHTAELTEESIADEVLHLAAAVQFCGFRSVVGTMWAMADIDGRDLSTFFYESVFSDKWQGLGVRYYERTAEALRDAVVKMRRKKAGMTLERWVNFVHYGA
jgi:CHAT domain-containing protein/tetratricopeptide (TPR) repeat protein